MKDVYYLYIYLGVIVLMSLISFFLYSWDKRKAISGKWRTKEKTLLLQILGGALILYFFVIK